MAKNNTKNKQPKNRRDSKSGLVTGCTAGKPMRNYLSFGGGVNSTALYFLMMDMGIEFEAVFVDHKCDWPETREYVREFSKRYPVTILTPQVEGRFESLYDYMWHYRMIPSRRLSFALTNLRYVLCKTMLIARALCTLEWIPVNNTGQG